MSKQVIKAALEAMCCMRDMVAHPDNLAFIDKHISALQAALAEPQTTHWEGCEAVHPECRKPEQEPDGISWLKRDSGYFTAPTPRKPLKEDEIADLWDGHTVPVFGKTGINPIVFARAIERAHGITGEQP